MLLRLYFLLPFFLFHSFSFILSCISIIINILSRTRNCPFLTSLTSHTIHLTVQYTHSMHNLQNSYNKTKKKNLVLTCKRKRKSIQRDMASFLILFSTTKYLHYSLMYLQNSCLILPLYFSKLIPTKTLTFSRLILLMNILSSDCLFLIIPHNLRGHRENLEFWQQDYY